MKHIKRNEQGFALVFALVTMTLIFIAVSGLTQSRQIWGFTASKQLDRTTMALTTRVDSVNWLTLFRYNAQKNPSSFSPSTLTLPSPSSFVTVTGANLFTPVSPYPQVTGGAPYSLPPNFWQVTSSSVSDPTVPVAPFDPYWGCNAALTGFGLTYAREMSSSLYALRSGSQTPSSSLKSWMSIDGALVQSVGLRYLPISIFTLYSPQPSATNALTLSTSASANPFSLQINPLSYSWSSSFSQTLYHTPNVGVGRLYVEGPVTINGTFPVGLPQVFTDGFSSSSAGTFSFNFPTFLGNGSTNIAVPTTTEDFLSKRYSYFRGLISCGYDTSQRLLRYSSTANINNKWAVSSPPQNYTSTTFQPNTGTAGLIMDLTGSTPPDVLIVVDVAKSSTNSPPVAAFFPYGGALPISGPFSGSDLTKTILYGFSTVEGDPLNSNTITPISNPIWQIDQATKTVTLSPLSPEAQNSSVLTASNHIGWFANFMGRAGVNAKQTDYPVCVIKIINSGNAISGINPNINPDASWKLKLANFKPRLILNSVQQGWQYMEMISPNAVVLDTGMESAIASSSSTLISPRIYVTSVNSVNGIIITDAWDTSSPFLVPSGTTLSASVNITGSLIIWSRPIGVPSESSVKVSLTPQSAFLDASFCPPLIPCVLDIRSAPKDFKTYQMSAH